MGIGRREFIAQFGSALAILASTPDAAAAALDDLYINRGRGIAFLKPRGWEFRDVREINRAQAGAVMEFEWFDPVTWADYVRTDDTYTSFVTAMDMRTKRYLPGVCSPEMEYLANGLSIHYEGTWESDGPNPLGPPSLADFVARDLNLFAGAYIEFDIISPPHPVTVSRCDAIEYTARLLYSHADLPVPVPMRERVLYIFQDPTIYSVHMFDFPELDPPLTHDFEPFIKTLQIL